jgi:hypothetical protein
MKSVAFDSRFIGVYARRNAAAFVLFRIVSALVAPFVTTGAWAAEATPGFYAGGGVGWSNVSVETSDDAFFPDYLTGEDDTAFELHFGYRIGRYMAAEFAYLETGPDWDETFYVPELEAVYRDVVDLDVRAAELGIVGVLPFARVWEAYLKGGIAFWEADADQTETRLPAGATTTRSMHDSGTQLLIALGVGANLSPAWHLRFEAQSFGIDRDLVLARGRTSIETMLFAAQFKLGAKARAAAE